MVVHHRSNANGRDLSVAGQCWEWNADVTGVEAYFKTSELYLELFFLSIWHRGYSSAYPGILQ